MTKHLQNTARKRVSARSKRSHQRWTPERRARQAALIRCWAPWRRSTGPKTEAGKAQCAMNALKHGYRSQARIREKRLVLHILRLADRNIKRLRLHIRMRDARLRIKYKFPPPHAVRVPESLAMLRVRFEHLSSLPIVTDQPRNTQTRLPFVGRRFGLALPKLRSNEGRVGGMPNQEIARPFQQLRPGTRMAATAPT